MFIPRIYNHMWIISKYIMMYVTVLEKPCPFPVNTPFKEATFRINFALVAHQSLQTLTLKERKIGLIDFLRSRMKKNPFCNESLLPFLWKKMPFSLMTAECALKNNTDGPWKSFFVRGWRLIREELVLNVLFSPRRFHKSKGHVTSNADKSWSWC